MHNILNNSFNYIFMRLARFWMTRFESFPQFDKDKVGLLQEVFNHPEFSDGTIEQQKQIMFKSSKSKYDNELNFPIDKYFGFNLLPYLKDKKVLDLGCLVGGRTVAWYQRYEIKHICGIDVNQVYIDAAKQFADFKQINAEFRKAYAENLPYEDNRFDAIITFDVFEHVQNLEVTLKECQRVLKPGGKLFVVFPSYYQPKEHHLGLVTRLPGLQYFFSGRTLVKTYYAIIKERGQAANWYKRNNQELEKWEKGNTINGTSFRSFHHLIKKQNWKTVFVGRKPIGSVGRSLENKRILQKMFLLLTPLTYIPFIQEFFLHRITFILEKE